MKCSLSLAIREMEIKTTLRFHLILVRVANIKITNVNLCWRRCGPGIFLSKTTVTPGQVCQLTMLKGGFLVTLKVQ